MTPSLLWLATALAADPTEARAARPDPYTGVVPEVAPKKDGITLLGLYQARSTLSNVITTSPFLDGQVVGVLGGTNATATSSEAKSFVTEQRLTGFAGWAPKLLDGRASITAGFEIDFAFGDQAYGEGGNTGGGFGADQVNLQTRRLYVDVVPVRAKNHHLTVRLGQQFVADGVRDPAAATGDDLWRTGGGMRFFGSEAAGLQAFGRVDDAGGTRVRYRAGAFTLWEQGSSLPDDVTLFLADAEYAPSYASGVGVHAWYLRDRSEGGAGLLGLGPTSGLSQLQGAPYLDLRTSSEEERPDVNADVLWFGVDGRLNHGLNHGPTGASGFFFLNPGTLRPVGGLAAQTLGMAAGAEIRHRYAPGPGSVVRAELLWTSGDQPGGAYRGVFTANSWGIVGAVYGSHNTVLLFPDVTAVNRQSSIVYDVTNQGRGLLAASASMGYDIVPHRVNATATVAHARTAYGAPVGTELNARITGEVLPFFDVGLTTAGVLGANLTAADGSAMPDPWTAYLWTQWVMFR